MKKKLILGLTVLIFILMFLGDHYLKQSFQMTLGDYLQTMEPLSESDQAYLNSLSVITYGADSNSPPLRYVEEQSAQYKGIVVDYIDALSIELGVPIEFTPMQWSDALSALSSGQIDICDMHPSDDRGQVYDFSTPIYYQRGVILTKKTSPIQSEDNLSHGRVAVNDGDYSYEYLKNTHPSLDVIAAKDLEAAITLFLEDEVDAVIGDESVIQYFIEKEKLMGTLYIASGFLYEQEAVIAVNKGNSQLLTLINRGIARLKTKNTMSKIYEKWYGEQPLITKDTQKYKWQFIIQLVMIVSLISVSIFYYWHRKLSHEVHIRTRDLNASTQVLETTFDSLEQYLIVLDNKKQVIQVNNSFASYMNLSKEALRTHSMQELNKLMASPLLIETIETAYNKNTVTTCTFEHDYRSYKMNAYPMDNQETELKLLIFIEDITDTVLQQRQLLQSRKMVAVGQLAAGVAHEIRNPIGLIRNHTFLLKRFIKPHLTEDIAESMQTIDQSIERVNSIINNLLNFSRQNESPFVPRNLRKFIEDILNLNKKVIQENQVQVDLDCDNDYEVPLHIESMKHIIINLLTNSLEALDPGGKISIRVIPSASGFELIFADNGHGIPDHLQPVIFNPFFTTKSPDSGTGLGLYIVYNEIEKIHGQIDVDSSPKGTRFKLFIPNQQLKHKEEHHE